MLRLKAAASKLSDITTGTFRPVIGDDSVSNASRVILCSGKIYWELVAERAKLGDNSSAIIRVEQLYPLPVNEIMNELNKHPQANVMWVQDEPANQGPWPFVSANLLEPMNGRTLRRVSRRAAASPATGSIYVHEEEQKALIAEVFSR
jgi:2-oxoglutarate dehydrogenase E1 component